MVAEPIETDIAIIGAGPKAIALAAKRWALQRARISAPSLVVLEKAAVGAHWDGHNGYTDGTEALVTPPEQDIGFPYLSTQWGEGIGRDLNDAMFNLSLQKFLLRTGEYGNWLIQGRRLTHARFTAYLRWVQGEIGLQHCEFEVRRISSFGADWLLSDGTGNLVRSRSLVVTGSGPARVLPGGTNHGNVLNGKNFWENLHQLQSDATVAIVGGGETAGTIAAAVARRIAITSDTTAKIFLIHNQPAYYSRGQAWGEQRWFIDPDGLLPEGPVQRISPTTPWWRLSPSHRREIISRADRGVVSVKVLNELTDAGIVESLPATVEHIDARDTGVELTLSYENQILPEPIVVDLLIVAIGFDSLWFLERMLPESRVKLILCLLRFRAATKDTYDRAMTELGLPATISQHAIATHFSSNSVNRHVRVWIQRAIEYSILRDLSVDGLAPKLHLPMLSGPAQGPGFPNLNSLGLLSDRILRAYT